MKAINYQLKSFSGFITFEPKTVRLAMIQNVLQLQKKTTFIDKVMNTHSINAKNGALTIKTILKPKLNFDSWRIWLLFAETTLKGGRKNIEKDKSQQKLSFETNFLKPQEITTLSCPVWLMKTITCYYSGGTLNMSFVKKGYLAKNRKRIPTELKISQTIWCKRRWTQ